MTRTFHAAFLVALGVLVAAGVGAGTGAARGPDRTVSSELVVDGARRTQSPSRGRRAHKPLRSGNRPGARRRPPLRPPAEPAVRVARTVDEVDGLRAAWEQLQEPRMQSDIDVFLTYVAHTPEVVRPHVVVVEERGEPVALAACRLEDRELETKVGYKTLFAPTLRTATVLYGGVFGAVDERRARLVVQALRDSIGPAEADVVRMRGLERGSPLHTVATAEAPFLRREHFGRPVTHWRSKVSGSLDDFLARRKKKVRWQARKDISHLTQTFGDDLEVRVFATRGELDPFVADSEAVRRTTYQHALGVGFAPNGTERLLTELAAERGWFRGYVLYLRGEPIAFWHGTSYRGVFGLSATGYVPTYAEHRPGGYLLMRLIEDLCEDPSVHTLDFGFGDATYKRQLGDEGRLEEDVVVFAARPKAVSVNLVRTAMQGSASAARSVLARRGHLDGVKRAWRERATGARRAS